MERVWIIIFALLCSLLTVSRAEDDVALLKSAHRGDVAAMRRIGMRMYRGVCSCGDAATGIRWLEKAAEKGDADAMYCLGRIHVTRSEELRKLYLKKAVDHGSMRALAYQNRRATSIPRASQEAPVINANRVNSPQDAVGSTEENDDEDGIDALLPNINKEASNMQLVYEYECDITDAYMIPDAAFGGQNLVDLELYDKEDAVHDLSPSHHQINKRRVQTTAARTLMRDIAKAAFRRFGEKEKVKRFMEIVALLGCTNTNNYDAEMCYVGPLQLCMAETARNLQFRENSEVYDIEILDFYHKFGRGEVGLSGNFRGNACCHFPAISYKSEITWRGGLPSHVKCRVDFTPSKAVMLKKTENN